MLTATLENVLNRGLPRSPRAQQLCAELAGRRLAIDVNPIGRILLESTGVSLKLSIAAKSVGTKTVIPADLRLPVCLVSFARGQGARFCFPVATPFFPIFHRGFEHGF